MLIRAMIAAANADHAVDDVERHAILEKVTASGLGAEERDFIEQELANPLDLRALVAQVKSPEMAEQVYAASVLALEVDSDAERNYLQRLASALNLDTARWQSGTNRRLDSVCKGTQRHSGQAKREPESSRLWIVPLLYQECTIFADSPSLQPMNVNTTVFDVCVVGSGAAGGTLSSRLARAGTECDCSRRRAAHRHPAGFQHTCDAL